VKKSNTAIFLFAHQDDESGCFYEIEKKISQGSVVKIFYLTSGTPDGKLSSQRNLESLNVLSSLGVKKRNIIFLGLHAHSPDGKLAKNINSLLNTILKLFINIQEIESFYFMAWEGGHQDHDATHLIGVTLAKKFNVIRKSYQFPLYTGIGLYLSFFRLFKVIKSNGPPIYTKIPWTKRFKYLKLLLKYPSQKRTWIGLFPFFIVHYFLYGTQILQPIIISKNKYKNSPHNGVLLYERRGFYSYELFKKDTSIFIQQYIYS